MANLLYLRASLFGDDGNSSSLAAAFIQRWQAAHPGGTITGRDLASQPLPHLDADRVSPFFTPAADRSAAQQAVIAQSDALIDELRRADHIVIGMPMYNFGIPSQFKAWIDHVARAGETFSYTENGPVGLLDNIPVTVLAAAAANMPTLAMTIRSRTCGSFSALSVSARCASSLPKA